jgi:hypothetical protein
MVGVAWSNDSDTCAGGNVSNGGTFNAREDKGDNPDLTEYPIPSGWVWT